MEIIFKALHTEMQERFRQHAMAKLAKIEKLDNKAIRIDVRGLGRAQPPAVRTQGAGRTDSFLARPGDPGGGSG